VVTDVEALHRRSQGMHVHPQGGQKKCGAKFTGKSCKCSPHTESAPPQGRARVPFFKGNWGDLGGGRGYLGSFSVSFEGDD